MLKRKLTEIRPSSKKKPKLVHDDLSPHNLNNPAHATYTFHYHPLALPHTSSQGLITNKITALYQVISPARLDLMLGIQKNKPSSIQQLSKVLRRDYSIVWRDIRALEELGLVKLHKQKKGKAIKPVVFIKKLIIEIPLVD